MAMTDYPPSKAQAARVAVEGPGGMYVSPPRDISDASSARWGSYGVWRAPATLRGVYRYAAEHRERMGNCEWLPSEGDLCVIEALSGDCFYDYLALRRVADGPDAGKYKRVGRFGAYVFGERTCVLDPDTWHQAGAGLPVNIP
jgi:hypothetical protein